jgi:pyridoxamine 5'-phosphate oxidase
VNILQFEDCIKFANDNPSSYIATVEGDQPRVRGMLLWFADKTGFYYSTGAAKDLYKQLQVNPKVELCFFDAKSKNMKMMRVTGKVEILNSLEIKKRLFDERPFLKQMGLTPENPSLIVFRMPKGEAFFWTMDSNTEEKKKIQFG